MSSNKSMKGVALTDGTTFEPSEEVLSQELDDEAVLLDLISEKYFSIDAVGTRIWKLVSEGVSLSGIVAALQCEFDVKPAKLEEDVREFLQALLDAGLIRIRVGPGY